MISEEVRSVLSEWAPLHIGIEGNEMLVFLVHGKILFTQTEVGIRIERNEG